MIKNLGEYFFRTETKKRYIYQESFDREHASQAHLERALQADRKGNLVGRITRTIIPNILGLGSIGYIAFTRDFQGIYGIALGELIRTAGMCNEESNLDKKEFVQKAVSMFQTTLSKIS